VLPDIVMFRRMLSLRYVSGGGSEREFVDNCGSQGFFSMSSMIWASWPIVVCSYGTEEWPPLPETVIFTSMYPYFQYMDQIAGGPTFSAVPGRAKVPPYRFLT